MAKEQDGESLVFDVNRIRQLIELMNEHELNEIDLRHSDRRIRMRRGAEITQVVSAPTASQTVAPSPTSAAVPGPAKATESATPSADDNAVVIKSPMVGTFYSRPKPDAAPYVKVGDVVQADSTVCLIEAMKTFNELPAGVSGKIVAVLVKDDEPVDVNKPLFKVVPG
ncbi:MAG TPA: acetyl-CoA carboxylase biotin carboxyl carrier protein [Pirellulaceae bacterium]|nr:acetyl-CoA carboxylase biotin carboxyl carrier protein [Pirellulaceae bacterium]